MVGGAHIGQAAAPAAPVAPAALGGAASRPALRELAPAEANVAHGEERARKRARSNPSVARAAQPARVISRVQLQPSVYSAAGRAGDFVHEVRAALRRQQGPRGSRTLWIFNDNEQDRHSSRVGGGNAQIRPYNSFGPHQAEPLAAGVTTGSNGQGYISVALMPAVRANRSSMRIWCTSHDCCARATTRRCTTRPHTVESRAWARASLLWTLRLRSISWTDSRDVCNRHEQT